MRLDTISHQIGAVTFVLGILENGSTRALVTVADRTGGPIWPPRRNGVPAVDWQDGTLTVRLEPEERRAIGYATDATPADPPLAIASVDAGIGPPADDRPHVTGANEVPAMESTPTGVVRALGDPRPPRPRGPHRSAGDAGDGSGQTPGRPVRPDRACQRIALAEALAEASDLEDAATHVAAAGGLEGVRQLAAEVRADQDQLRRLAEHARTLADRAGAVDVPVAAVDRLS